MGPKACGIKAWKASGDHSWFWGLALAFTSSIDSSLEAKAFTAALSVSIVSMIVSDVGFVF